MLRVLALGWGRLGTGATSGSKSLNLSASALEVSAGTLYVGGKFTDAGGIPNADRIAKWNGSSWSAVSSSTEQITNGEVFAIAVAGGKVYAGGTFTNAGTGGADNLAVWDGTGWKPFCTPPATTIGNVKALQVVGPTLYVGGDFQDGAGIATADYLLACDLATGTPSATTADPAHPFSGPVKALTATSDGTLYAGGRFLNLENIDGRRQRRVPATRRDVARHGLERRRPHLRLCAGRLRPRAGRRRDRRRSSAPRDRTSPASPRPTTSRSGTDRRGAPWARTPAARTGGSRRRPTIYGLASVGSNVFATGTFQNADGDARADNVAWFDGTAWHPLGSNGAGNGPWVGEGSALALVDRPALRGGELHERRR